MKNSLVLVGLSLALFHSPSLHGQSVGIGIKAGVPLTDVLQPGAITRAKVDTTRLAIGPVMEVRFPFGLGIEVGALYKRFRQTGQTGPRDLTVIDQSGRSWEFPVLAKVRLPGVGIRPYVEGGFSYNRLTDIVKPFQAAIANPRDLVNSIGRPGFVMGGGIEIGSRKLRLQPGLRWTRYNTSSFIPSVNSIDFLVGLMF
ncbi:MAG: hypothetical protein K2X03_16305 [Bryobacteraceae bacterium]|nr:hypothetical protein [Bryobacteraceae bacterium]